MRPIAAEVGQILQLVLMDEVRPLRGAAFAPDFVSAVTQRYRFMSFPTQISEMAQLKFQVGAMSHGHRTITVNSLEIYNDGIVVNTKHTDDSDLVLDDFAVWAKDQFNLREPTTIIPRGYFSAVIAEFDDTLGKIISNFDRLTDVVSKALGVDALGFHRLAISNDPLQRAGHKTWQIEPRASQPFVPNRYFSTAHLRTSDHFDMLARLETLFRD